MTMKGALNEHCFQLDMYNDVKKVDIFIILKKGNLNKPSYMEILKLDVQFC